MNSILALSLLLLGGIPSILAYRCLRNPIHFLDNPCAVRNLTVLDVRNRLITGDYSCGSGVSRESYALEWPYVINFTYPVGPQFQFSSFLLTVVDTTSRQLLWMVANITVPRNDRKLTPLLSFGPYSKSFVVKAYEMPRFNATHRTHQIEFMVFQQMLNYLPRTYGNNLFGPFNLVQWLDGQVASGAFLCGPVAGAAVTMHDNTYYPPPHPGNNYPPQQNHPTYPYKPPASQGSHNKGHAGNSAFRFNSNTSLLSAIVGMIFFWYSRE